MKRLVVILFAWFFTAPAFSQSTGWLEVDDAYRFAKSEIAIPLPFRPNKMGRYRHYFSLPQRELYFRGLKDENIELPIVKDLQLVSTLPPYKPEIDRTWGWGVYGQLPTPSSSKFVVLLTGTASGPVLSTDGFVSIDSNNCAIDRLITCTEGLTKFDICRFREFTVDTDTVITVYTVRSIEPGSTLFWDVKGNSFRGQRTDTRYKVSAEGRFVEIDKIVYRPQLYKLSTLSNLKLNIRDGREKRIE